MTCYVHGAEEADMSARKEIPRTAAENRAAMLLVREAVRMGHGLRYSVRHTAPAGTVRDWEIIIRPIRLPVRKAMESWKGA